MAAHLLALACERQQLGLGSLGCGLDPIAQLAVDLDDKGDGVAGKQLGIGPRPRLLPDPALLESLPDLGAQMRGKGEDQRSRGGGGEANRSGALWRLVETIFQ